MTQKPLRSDLSICTLLSYLSPSYLCSQLTAICSFVTLLVMLYFFVKEVISNKSIYLFISVSHWSWLQFSLLLHLFVNLSILSYIVNLLCIFWPVATICPVSLSSIFVHIHYRKALGWLTFQTWKQPPKGLVCSRGAQSHSWTTHDWAYISVTLLSKWKRSLRHFYVSLQLHYSKWQYVLFWVTGKNGWEPESTSIWWCIWYIWTYWRWASGKQSALIDAWLERMTRTWVTWTNPHTVWGGGWEKEGKALISQSTALSAVSPAQSYTPPLTQTHPLCPSSLGVMTHAQRGLM